MGVLAQHLKTFIRTISFLTYHMKTLLLLTACLLAALPGDWGTNFEKAKTIAKEKHQLILLNFSGSDWCGPCMRMRKEVFDNGQFASMADSLLVLVNADFPRNKKNQLEKNVQQQNDKLADTYNSQGAFPFTVLLDENGKVLKSWDGLPKDAGSFIQDIKNIAHARKP